jgi:hypothetical protein
LKSFNDEGIIKALAQGSGSQIEKKRQARKQSVKTNTRRRDNKIALSSIQLFYFALRLSHFVLFSTQ